MIIVLTLNSGNAIRFNISNIASYVKYDYTYKEKERKDDFTTLYTIDGKTWTVNETPDQIDIAIVNNLGIKY